MIDRSFFFNHVRSRPFDGAITSGQVSGMDAILSAWEKCGLTDLRWLAYLLATTFHETARTMQPIEEYGKGHGKAYGVPAGPWHLVYDGRGDVQITWEANYKKAAIELQKVGIHVDLDQHPELAMRPDVAAAILIHGCAEGWFTGKKLSDYFGRLIVDPVNARRIVNGLDQASAIADYYYGFVAALVMAKDVQVAAIPLPAIPAVTTAGQVAAPRLAPIPTVTTGPHITGVAPATPASTGLRAWLRSWWPTAA